MGALTSCNSKVCRLMITLNDAAQRRRHLRRIDYSARPKFLRIKRKPRRKVCKCTCDGLCKLTNNSRQISHSETSIGSKKKSVVATSCSEGCGDENRASDYQIDCPSATGNASCQTSKPHKVDFGCSPQYMPQQRVMQCPSRNNSSSPKCECKKQTKLRSKKCSPCSNAGIQSYTYCSKIVETEPTTICMKNMTTCIGDQNFDSPDTDSASQDDYQIPTKPNVDRKTNISKPTKGKNVIFKDTTIQTCTPDNRSKYVSTSSSTSNRNNVNGRFSIDAYFVR